MSRPGTLVPSLPRPAWLVLGGDALSAVGIGLTMPFLLVYLHRVREMDLELAALAVSTLALASFLGNPAGGSLSDRIGSRTTLMLGLVASAVGTAAVPLVRETWHAFARHGGHRAGSVGELAGAGRPPRDGRPPRTARSNLRALLRVRGSRPAPSEDGEDVSASF